MRKIDRRKFKGKFKGKIKNCVPLVTRQFSNDFSGGKPGLVRLSRPTLLIEANETQQLCDRHIQLCTCMFMNRKRTH